jgi:hypothetical protein
MTTCFVIQPFDSGKYDKRYADVYRPAIVDAGLEPYRVDKDPSVHEVLVHRKYTAAYSVFWGRGACKLG